MHTHRPIVDFRMLRNPFGRSMEPSFEKFGYSDEEAVTGNWAPPVDVIEENARIVLRAELAGIRQDAIDISFAEGVLTIRGERPFEKESDARRYHRIERVYGSFSRSFTLPRTADPERISASFTDGILEVSVPKRDEARPRQIRVEVK